tara:strand:- start:299 stop:610 length:312 start_codon:yes stop_codon:yes gene_type:complete
LEREVIRETSIEVDDRNLIIHMTPDDSGGKIGFRLKGLSKEALFISIAKVYQLMMEQPDDDIEELPEVEGISMAAVFRDIEKENMPWPYKSALRKFIRKKYLK